MASSLEVEDRHLHLRHKLDTLGFCQPLPIGAIGLVGAILDDLVQTTDSLKLAKDEIRELRDVSDFL